jgi:hypothetical protein
MKGADDQVLLTVLDRHRCIRDKCPGQILYYAIDLAGEILRPAQGSQEEEKHKSEPTYETDLTRKYGEAGRPA